MCAWLWFFCLSVFSFLFPTFYSKISSVFLYISTLKESKGHLVFLSVLFSCCVWYFRRWLSPTLYQTTATFVLGDRPPYVESLHRFPSESPFINLPSPPTPSFISFASPAHAKRPHRDRIAVFVSTFAPPSGSPFESVTCASVLIALFTQHVYFDAAVNCGAAGLMTSVSDLLLCNWLPLVCP